MEEIIPDDISRIGTRTGEILPHRDDDGDLTL
jgi:hypothetical protein